jgi:hypothetical protein
MSTETRREYNTQWRRMQRTRDRAGIAVLQVPVSIRDFQNYLLETGAIESVEEAADVGALSAHASSLLSSVVDAALAESKKKS